MRLLVLAAAVISAGAFDLDTQSVKSVKGGHSSFQYRGGDLSRFNSSFQQNGYQRNSSYGGGGGSYQMPVFNYEIGVCYIEVPTANLVRDKVHVPAGNGSRPDLSRIRTCCHGYARNVYNFRICEPVCEPECINALCTAPGVCTCFPDHVRNLAGICVATCPIGCQNGHCDGGECLCKEGFHLDRDGRFCVPTCRNNCGGFGNCTAPNVCECQPGYQSTPDGSCKSSGSSASVCGLCENGDCISATECRCRPGYVKDRRGHCAPHCNQNCGPNGRCLAPNVCSMSPGSAHMPNQPPIQQPNTQYPHPNQNNTYYYNPNQGIIPMQPYNLNGPQSHGLQQQNQSNPYYPNQGSGYPHPNPSHPNQGSAYPQPKPQENGQQPNPLYPNQGSNYPQPNGPQGANPQHHQNYPQPGSNYQPNPYHPQQGSNYPQYPYNQNPSHGQNAHNPLDDNQQNPVYHPTFQVINITNHPQYPLYPENQFGFNGTYPSNQGNQPGLHPENRPFQPNQDSQYPHQRPQQNGYPTPQHGYYPYGQDPYSNVQSYEQTQDSSLCSVQCVNAMCIDHNRCRCNPGYITDESDPSGNRCRPNCPGGCPNGYCAAPHSCACDEGFYRDTSVKGRAVCVKRIRRSLLDLVYLIPDDEK